MRKDSGFTLIEMIISITILGFVLTVGALFFATMLRGFTTARISAQVAQAAEIALDRMVFELKDATGAGGGSTVTLVANTSVTYESTNATLSGTRVISFDGSQINLAVDGTAYPLLDDVTAFTLGVTENNIDGVAGNEISSFDLSFEVQGYGGTFSAQVAPRTFINR